MISDAEIKKQFVVFFDQSMDLINNHDFSIKEIPKLLESFSFSAYVSGFKSALALSEKMQAEKCCWTCKYLNSPERYCKKTELGLVSEKFINSNFCIASYCCCYWQKRED